MDEIRRYLEKFGIELQKGKMSMEGKEVFFFTGREVPLEGTRGLHVGTLDGNLRLSIDACQLATKGFIEVDEKEAKQWMCGLDLNKEAEGDYVILKFGRYILGAGKPRNGKILNNLPKNRRLPLRSI